jgi:predicted permease
MHWISDLSRDVSYACRALSRQPVFAAVAIGTLGLALGANTAMFGLVNKMLIAHLPVHEPERLVLLSRTTVTQAADTRFPYLFCRQLIESSDQFDGVLCRAAGSERVTVGTDTGGEPALGELVSGNFFEVLGVQPHLGRLLTSSDDVTPGAHPVVVVSYRYWQRQLGGDPAAIGRTLRFTGVPMTVIGVSPPGFDGLDTGQAIDLRFPLAMQAEIRQGPPRPGGPRTPTTLADRRAADMFIVGRQRRHVTPEQAEQAVTVSFQRFVDEGGQSAADLARARQRERVRLTAAATGIGLTRRQYETSLRVMMAVTASVLVIACLNLANLILARGSARAREFAVRVAIGAASGRLVRQLLAENLVLSVGGATLGALIAYPGSALLLRVMSADGSAPPSIDADWTVLLFHGLTAMLAVALFGLAPALASRRDAFSLMRTATGSRSATPRRIFLAAQVALSIVVLVGALLFVRSVHALRATDLGLRADHLLVLALSPQNAGRSADQTLPYFRAVRERVAALPGVTDATYAWIRPLSNATWRTDVAAEGCCADGVSNAFRNVVGPGYFATMGIPMVEGRDFADGDDRDAPRVAVVNQAFARAYGGGRSVLGARIGVSRPEFTIVGVSADAKYANVRDAIPPVWYVPYEQQPNVKYLNLYVRTAGDAEHITDSVRAAIADVDRGVALFEVRTVEAQIDNLLIVERMVATLATFFGSTGAALAALGVYGTLAYIVTTRRREIGIRMALGAGPGAIVRQMIAEAWKPLGVGALAGAAIAAALTQYTASLLYGVTPLDLVSFAGSILFMTIVVVVAASLPARRASRLDPTTALREGES